MLHADGEDAGGDARFANGGAVRRADPAAVLLIIAVRWPGLSSGAVIALLLNGRRRRAVSRDANNISVCDQEDRLSAGFAHWGSPDCEKYMGSRSANACEATRLGATRHRRPSARWRYSVCQSGSSSR